MEGFTNKLFAKIQQNGLKEDHSQYELEKIAAFNLQISICIFVSFSFIALSLFYSFFLLSYFATSYLILFIATYYCNYKRYNLAAAYIYLFVTNFSVFTISFCFGYDCGFYFYFLTTPLTVYVTFGNFKKVFIYLALATYLTNAIVLNLLYHKGFVTNPGIISAEVIDVLFNINLLISFLMIFIFINSYVRMNKIKSKEAEDLLQNQIILQEEIHKKELDEVKNHYHYKKLENEYQKLDSFNQILSHNLRGPISRVSGLLTIMQDFPETTEEQKKIMGHLNTSIVMIDQVVKDLNYILVQKKLVQDATESLSLQEILSEVKLHLSEEIKNSGAKIHDHLFSEKITCVKAIVISIFYNLISNSIKYAIPNEKPVIHIFAEVKNNQLVLTFEDDGIGFDSDKNADKLFLLYQRFHTHVQGKGMGLFLVKSHVDMLEGSIDVESTPMKGTTFVIRLPIKMTYSNFFQ